MAEEAGGVIVCCRYPSLWYARRQRHGFSFPACGHMTGDMTRGNLFSKLQMSSAMNFFYFFAVLRSREMTAGCYIDFSGFSTSRANLAQEQFLNTTCVTAGTSAHPRGNTGDRAFSGHIQETKNKQGLHSWRRYLIVAPMLWLARAWC